MRGFGIRRRLQLVVVSAVALAVAALLIGFNLLLANSLDRSSRDLLRSRAAAQLSLLRSNHGQLSLVDVPDAAGPDANVWVFSEGRLIEHPRAGARATTASLLLSHRISPKPAILDPDT